jgi:hypothetical protein
MLSMNSSTVSVFYIGLVCSLKMTLTGSKHVGVSNSFSVFSCYDFVHILMFINTDVLTQ